MQVSENKVNNLSIGRGQKGWRKEKGKRGERKGEQMGRKVGRGRQLLPV